jgi:hypothetical protein
MSTPQPEYDSAEMVDLASFQTSSPPTTADVVLHGLNHITREELGLFTHPQHDDEEDLDAFRPGDFFKYDNFARHTPDGVSVAPSETPPLDFNQVIYSSESIFSFWRLGCVLFSGLSVIIIYFMSSCVIYMPQL